jgi:outer membrane protein OmpA-like peptidoglycan-associated protein
MVKSRILVFSLLLVCVQSFGQNSLLSMIKDPVERGDQFFHEFAYTSAIEVYKQGLITNDQGNEVISIKIAESYRLLNDPKSAAEWYNKVLVDKPEVEAVYYLNFADALSSEKNYADAKIWYDYYGTLIKNDGRVEKKINTIHTQKELFRNVATVSIKKEEFNGPGADFSPALYAESIVFVSSRENSKGLPLTFLWDNSEYLDFYQVNEVGEVSRFSKKLNTKYHEGPMVFFDNNSKVIFTRNNYHKGRIKTDKEGVTKLKMYSSELDKNGVDWVNITPLSINSDEYSVGHPAISSDGTILYFASDMPGGLGGTDLYRSFWKDGNWTEPENLGDTINTEGNELFPFFHNDKDLYFSSNGHGGLGGLDVFGVDISKGLNGKINNIGAPINSNLDDFGIILQPDGKSGYFSTNRENSLNNDDIYSFTTTEPLIQNYIIKGIVFDKMSKAIISDGLVYLVKDEKIIAQSKTDSEGNYSFLVKPNTSYELHSSSKNDYLPFKTDIVTIESDKNYWEKNLYLTKDFGFELFIKVTDKQSGEPLKDVAVVVVDNLTDKTVIETSTSASGQESYKIEDKELNDRVSYLIKLSKEGYLSKILTYNAALDQPGSIDLSQSLDLALDKIEIGTDIGKLIDIKPIYFDLGKYNIRKDAGAELDKIVEIMNQNPTWEIELGSHTDSRGSASSNLGLSDKRAKASAQYIIDQGIDGNRIVGKGYGEALLINKCADGVKCSSDEHQENRRTEFKITKY